MKVAGDFVLNAAVRRWRAVAFGGADALMQSGALALLQRAWAFWSGGGPRLHRALKARRESELVGAARDARLRAVFRLWALAAGQRRRREGGAGPAWTSPGRRLSIGGVPTRGARGARAPGGHADTPVAALRRAVAWPLSGAGLRRVAAHAYAAAVAQHRRAVVERLDVRMQEVTDAAAERSAFFVWAARAGEQKREKSLVIFLKRRNEQQALSNFIDAWSSSANGGVRLHSRLRQLSLVRAFRFGATMLRLWKDATARLARLRVRMGAVSHRWFCMSKKIVFDRWKLVRDDVEFRCSDRVMKLRLSLRNWQRHQRRKAGKREQLQVIQHMLDLQLLRKCLRGFRLDLRAGIARRNRLHLEAFFGVQRMYRVLRSTMHSWAVAVFLQPGGSAAS